LKTIKCVKLRSESAHVWSKVWSPASLAAAFPHEKQFNLTPRAYCVETARDAGKRGGFVAASRAFSSALAHAPVGQLYKVERSWPIASTRLARVCVHATVYAAGASKRLVSTLGT
jgi:hypothetical protein